MTVSIWSYDDLDAEYNPQPAPDPNPRMPCHECGDEYRYKEYWKPRYVDPDDVDPHEATWLCGDCKSVVRRAEENERLDEYTTS